MDKTKQKHKEKTLKAFLYNIIGVILPFILSMFVILLFGEFKLIWKFFDEGQILLFGAGFYTISKYIFEENDESVVRTIDKVLSVISFWFLVFCSSIYAIIYCCMILGCLIPENGIYFLRAISFLLFIFSVISIYRSIHIDLLKVYKVIDVEKESKNAVDNIMERL